MRPPLLIAFVLLLPSAATANDTVVGGRGSDLVPLATADVRMVAEDILIEHVPPPGPSQYDVNLGEWAVTAHYTFENQSENAIELQVGFPEYACEGGDPKINHDIMCDPEPLRFQSMHTNVNGETVKHRRGTIRKGHPWLPRLGQVWLYDIRFEPRSEVRVLHRYRVREGQISDGTSLGDYVTRTGAAWAGPIGHARFRIHLPASSRYVSVEPENTGLNPTFHLVDVDGVTTGESKQTEKARSDSSRLFIYWLM